MCGGLLPSHNIHTEHPECNLTPNLHRLHHPLSTVERSRTRGNDEDTPRICARRSATCAGRYAAVEVHNAPTSPPHAGIAIKSSARKAFARHRRALAGARL